MQNASTMEQPVQPTYLEHVKEGLNRVKIFSLMVFTSQISAMIEAGIPIKTCIENLAREMTDRKVAFALQQISNDLEEGKDLATAMSRFPHIFNSLYISMVRVGSDSGELESAFAGVSEYLEKAVELRQRMFQALAYPAFMVVIAAAAIATMLFGIIPRFKELYSQNAAALPATTKAIINLSDFLVANAFFFFLFLAIATFAVSYMFSTSRGRYFKDRIKLRMAIFGKLVEMATMARFTGNLAMLLRINVPILEALDLSSATLNNAYYHFHIIKARQLITSGVSITNAFRDCGVFSGVVLEMMAVGEEAGNLEEMLKKISVYYERQVDITVRTIVSLVEPIATLLIGLFIGMAVIVLYQPIFNISSISKSAVGGH